MPPALVQRKALKSDAEWLPPTTVPASALMASASLAKLPPVKSPSGARLAAQAVVVAVNTVDAATASMLSIVTGDVTFMSRSVK
jgi:hypothetical protein